MKNNSHGIDQDVVDNEELKIELTKLTIIETNKKLEKQRKNKWK